MENDLLAHEVRFLRARLAELPEIEARAEKAERDARYVVSRLARSPLGPLLRRKEGWRVMEHEYLGNVEEPE